jgi:hypothetical protein
MSLLRSLKLPRFTAATRRMRAPRELFRDPAVWAWLLVALLAILPARAVLAGG